MLRGHSLQCFIIRLCHAHGQKHCVHAHNTVLFLLSCSLTDVFAAAIVCVDLCIRVCVRACAHDSCVDISGVTMVKVNL